TTRSAERPRGRGQFRGRRAGRGGGGAAVRDGLEGLANPNAPQMTPVDGHFVALVIWPGNDYHWYRPDDLAQWSHKPGQTAARDYDNAGQPIADPKSCDRGPYTEFVAFFQTFPNRIIIR